jgi:hypothetical protein
MLAVVLAFHASVQARIRLANVSDQTGITFTHTDGSSGQRYIMETVSAGLALFDYDNDGDVDIYFLNGAPLKGTKADTPPQNALYRSDGNWKFTDVTATARVGDTGYGLGVAVGDYDNDGDPDIYLNNFGPNVLYRNNGNGTFTDVTRKAGVGNGAQVGAGACFLDMDADGDLDLYASNYLDFAYDKHVLTATKGFPVYANPRFYPPLPDTPTPSTATMATEPSPMSAPNRASAPTLAGAWASSPPTTTMMAIPTSSSPTTSPKTSSSKTTAPASSKRSGS